MNPFSVQEQEFQKEKKREGKTFLFRLLMCLLGVLLVIGIWELIAYILSSQAASFVFPEFFTTVGKMVSLFTYKTLWVGTGYTVLRILISLSVSLVLGYFLGLLSSFYEPLEYVLKPLVYVLTALPTISVILVLVIFTKITSYAVVFLLSFPIVYKAVLLGGKKVKEEYGPELLLEGKYRAGNFCRIYMPLSLPHLFLGLSQTSGLCLKSEIMAETFLRSNKNVGLGQLIQSAYTDSDFLTLMALTLFAILIMGLVDLGFYFVKKSLNGKYGTGEEKIYHW